MCIQVLSLFLFPVNKHTHIHTSTLCHTHPHRHTCISLEPGEAQESRITQDEKMYTHPLSRSLSPYICTYIHTYIHTNTCADDQNLEKSAGMRKHAGQVMRMLGQAVAGTYANVCTCTCSWENCAVQISAHAKPDRHVCIHNTYTHTHTHTHTHAHTNRHKQVYTQDEIICMTSYRHVHKSHSRK